MEIVRIITSADGRHRIDIRSSGTGLYRFVTYSDRYRDNEDFQEPPHWTIENQSGLYPSAEAAEGDARAQFAWLRD